MREIVLDTETTGLDPSTGDRIVEIGCVEVVNYLATGNSFHVYLNPDRMVPKEAQRVHGLSDEFLADKPRFREIARRFLDFIGSDTLVIHNASFDVKFLNAELAMVKAPAIQFSRVIDTLDLARKKFPGAQASLDALCRRFAIDTSARELHGALLDAQLLAEVYLELKGGRQPQLIDGTLAAGGDGLGAAQPARQRPGPRPVLITQAERDAHRAFVQAELGPKQLWYDEEPAQLPAAASG